MIAIILLIAFIALLAWVVYAAGPKFALKRFGGAFIVLVLVTFGRVGDAQAGERG